MITHTPTKQTPGKEGKATKAIALRMGGERVGGGLKIRLGPINSRAMSCKPPISPALWHCAVPSRVHFLSAIVLSSSVSRVFTPKTLSFPWCGCTNLSRSPPRDRLQDPALISAANNLAHPRQNPPRDRPIALDLFVSSLILILGFLDLSCSCSPVVLVLAVVHRGAWSCKNCEVWIFGWIVSSYGGEYGR